MATTLASDGFARTVAAGSWGSADLGGAWTLVNGSAAFSVGSGVGQCAMQPTYDRQAYLNEIASTNTHIRVDLKSSSAYDGAAQSFNVIGRKTAAGLYQARVRIEDGLLRLYIMRGETALVSSTTISHAYVPDEVIKVDLLVAGTGPTTISAKMWLATASEPGSYQQTATDATAGYQEAGAIGFKFNLGSSAAAAVYKVDNLQVEDPTATVLASPNATLTHTIPSTVGGSDGSITATWPAVAGAHHYETCLLSGAVSTGAVADDSNATSPKTYSGLPAGVYTIAVRAKAA